MITTVSVVIKRTSPQGIPGIVLHLFALSPGTHYLPGVESPEVLSGYHKTGSTSVNFCIFMPEMHCKFENEFFGKHFA